MSHTTRYATPFARYLLGGVFFVFGWNFFLHFLPQPPLPAGAGGFIGALVHSGYVMPIVKSVEVVAGGLLLANRFVPLALALLAPIVVAITGFHLALAPAAGMAAYVSLVLELSLAYAYRNAFAPMLQPRVLPANAPADSGPERHVVGAAHV